jgi:hypothetical protein
MSRGYLFPTPISPYPLKCYCIEIPDAPEYRYAFRDALEELTHWYNWEWDDTHNAADVAQYWRDILLPQLEVDMTCCCNEASSNEQANSLLNQLATWNTYHSNAAINPDTPDTTFDTDSRDSTPSEEQATVDALCAACQDWIDNVIAGAKAYANSVTNGSNLIAAIGFGVAALVPVIGWVAGAAIVAAAIGAAAAIGSSIVSLVASGIFDDADAISTVKCALYNALQGQSVTESEFKTAIFSLSDTGNAGIIEGFARNMMNSGIPPHDLYHSFINDLGTARQRQQSIGDLECECVTTWCENIDFTVDDGGFVESDALGGNYTVAVGWEAEDVFVSPYWYRRVTIEYDFGAPVTFRQITFQYDSSLDAGDVRAGDNVYINFYNSGVEDLIAGGPTGDGSGHFFGWTGHHTADTIQFVLIVSTRPAHTNGGAGVILNCEVCGEGVNPF